MQVRGLYGKHSHDKVVYNKNRFYKYSMQCSVQAAAALRVESPWENYRMRIIVLCMWPLTLIL